MARSARAPHERPEIRLQSVLEVTTNDRTGTRTGMPRRYGRVKAKPPSAVRFAQP